MLLFPPARPRTPGGRRARPGPPRRSRARGGGGRSPASAPLAEGFFPVRRIGEPLPDNAGRSPAFAFRCRYARCLQALSRCSGAAPSPAAGAGRRIPRRRALRNSRRQPLAFAPPDAPTAARRRLRARLDQVVGGRRLCEAWRPRSAGPGANASAAWFAPAGRAGAFALADVERRQAQSRERQPPSRQPTSRQP